MADAIPVHGTSEDTQKALKAASKGNKPEQAVESEVSPFKKKGGGKLHNHDAVREDH